MGWVFCFGRSGWHFVAIVAPNAGFAFLNAVLGLLF
jgi:hypothetical protein